MVSIWDAYVSLRQALTDIGVEEAELEAEPEPEKAETARAERYQMEPQTAGQGGHGFCG